jgi:hypothetical protein
MTREDIGQIISAVEDLSKPTKRVIKITVATTLPFPEKGNPWQTD